MVLLEKVRIPSSLMSKFFPLREEPFSEEARRAGGKKAGHKKCLSCSKIAAKSPGVSIHLKEH